MSRRAPAAAEALAAALLGAAQTLALVHGTAWWLALLCIAALAQRVARVPVARAALLGAAYGSAWIAAAVWWLFISMHRYGGLSAPSAVAAVALLALALSLYLALAMGLFARLRTGRAVADVPLFAALWLLAELARGVLFTGFPWAASGYGQIDGPLAWLAPWVGVYGIGAVLAALAAAVARGTGGGAVAALVLTVAALLPRAQFSEPGATLRVALVQTGVAQDEKFAPERLPQALDWLAGALTGAEADLVVAPETAIPLLPGQLDELVPGYRATLQAHFAQPGRAALLGLPLGDFDRGYTNSVAGWSAAGSYRYDKHHLVPFGEFIPRGFRWFTDLMNIPLGDFDRGGPNQPSFAVGGEQLAPNICYEDLFGEELARRFDGPGPAPTILVNLSNIGWFGDTIAIDQHLAISRLRSLELQRPMLRATNTGATAIIDHEGRVTAQWPRQQRGVLHGTVQGRHGLTPLARWAAWAGLWPLAGPALALVGLAAWRRRRH